MKKIIALLLLVSAVYSCEPDDICSESTPTTPRLIIEFYDLGNPEETKSVINLLIQGIGNENPLQTVSTEQSISLPLKIIDDDLSDETVTTEYILHKEYDADNPAEGNEDKIILTYNVKDVYVSRACGYKTIFENVILSVEDDGNKWILSNELANEPLTVENETATHIKIYH